MRHEKALFLTTNANNLIVLFQASCKDTLNGFRSNTKGSMYNSNTCSSISLLRIWGCRTTISVNHAFPFDVFSLAREFTISSACSLNQLTSKAFKSNVHSVVFSSRIFARVQTRSTSVCVAFRLIYSAVACLVVDRGKWTFVVRAEIQCVYYFSERVVYVQAGQQANSSQDRAYIVRDPGSGYWKMSRTILVDVNRQNFDHSLHSHSICNQGWHQ